MKKYSLLYVSFAMVVVLATLHFIAEAFYFYWTIWWFDNLMHLLGGLSVGLVIVWLLFNTGLFSETRLSNLKFVFLVVVLVLLVGIVWEIFEYLNDITQSFEGYTLDTSLDLFFDTLGAILAGLIGTSGAFRLRN